MMHRQRLAVTNSDAFTVNPCPYSSFYQMRHTSRLNSCTLILLGSCYGASFQTTGDGIIVLTNVTCERRQQCTSIF